MSTLSDYNPIKRIKLPGVSLEDPTGIVVVVGPNSSGKTLLLQDVENYLLTGEAKWVVCNSMAFLPPKDFQAFIDDLRGKRYLRDVPGQRQQYQLYVPFLSTKKQGEGHFNHDQLKKACDGFVCDDGGNNQGFFSRVGQALVAQVTLATRREVANRVQSFNYEQQTPDHPVQGFFVNSDAQERLAIETGNVFGNAVWLDITENGVLQMRGSGANERPAVMTDPFKAREYMPIEKEGDGYRSYIGTCLCLLLGVRPVSLIDEPELCLHPPQAYRIGRFIGSNAQPNHLTMVATHSSHVLRGILETGNNVTIIRLTRNPRTKKFAGHRLIAEEVKAACKNPRATTESLLDGIFAKGVVVVESEGDRVEYGAACEAIPDYPAREVHFLSVSGGGGFGDAFRFYHSLRIPVAIISDLDYACEVNQVAPILTAHQDKVEEVKVLLAEMSEMARKIKELSPPITEVEAKTRLKEWSERPLNWMAGDDNKLRREMNAMREQLRRIQKLKDGGVVAYDQHPEIKELLLSVVGKAAALGLFFVPVGELDDWVKWLMEDAPKSDSEKLERAVVAASRIRETPASERRKDDIWDFVRKVLDYLAGNQG